MAAEAPPIEIPVIAVDNASATLERITGTIAATGRVTREQVRELRDARYQSWLLYGSVRYLRQAYLAQNITLWAGVQAFGRLGSVARMSLQTFTQYQTMMFRIERLQRDLKDAQNDYTDALFEYGSGSRQAQQAAGRLRDTQESLRRAQQQSWIFWGLTIAQIPRYIQLTFEAVTGIKAFAAVLIAKAAAQAAGTAVEQTATVVTVQKTLADFAATTMTGQRTMAEYMAVASTGASTAADVAHTGVIWGKVGALAALKAALLGVQLAGIPVVGWLAAAGIAGVGAYAAYTYATGGGGIPRAQFGGIMKESGLVYAERGERFIPPGRQMGGGMNFTVERMYVSQRGRGPEAIMREFWLAAKAGGLGM